METNDFYLGVLNELQKTAQQAPMASPPIAPAPKPIAPPAPAGPSMWQGIKNTAGNVAGNVAGHVADFTTNHPTLTANNPIGWAGRQMQSLANNTADQKINSIGMGDVTDKPGPPQGGMQNFQQGFLKGDTGFRNKLNDPNDPNSLLNKSWGAASVDQNGAVQKDLSKVPGYAMNKFEGWMGQHPWLTGIGGGLALTGILGSLMHRNQPEQQPININVNGQGTAAPTAPKFLE